MNRLYSRSQVTLPVCRVCTAVLPACVHRDTQFLVGDKLVNNNGESLRGLKMDQVGKPTQGLLEKSFKKY